MAGLAAKIRAKYPGAYDDIPDADLEQKVLAKYPQYRDLVEPEPPAAPKDDMPGLAGAPSFLRLAGRVMKTAYENPVESLALAGGALAVPFTGGASLPASVAAAGLGGAGGAGLGTIVKAARGDADTPKTPGAVLGTMAQQGAVQAAGQGTGALAAGAARGSLRLMQSALKPTASLVKSRAGVGVKSAKDVAQAVLNEGRIVSPGSLAKAQDALEATDAAAQAALKAGAGRGVTVDPFQVTQNIGNVGKQFGRQINAAPDVAAVQGVREAFATNPLISDPVTGMAPIPADLAHEIASNTGRNLRGKFGRLGGATVEAEKAGRASITDQLRTGIPELEPLWQREAQQITTRDALEAALARRGNTDPIGLTGVVGAVKNPALMAGALADKSAYLKSLLAQALKRSQGTLGLLPTGVRSALAARLLSEPAQDSQ